MPAYQEKQHAVFEKLEKDAAAGQAKATFVEPLKDYAGDQKICLTSVVFLSPSLRQAVVEKIVGPLQNTDRRQYYSHFDSLHITTQNVRTIHQPPLFTNQDIIKAKEVFQKVVPKYKVFNFNLRGLLELPTSLAIRAYSDSTLKDLVLELRQELRQAGVPDDKKYASEEVVFGNTTICRYTTKPNADFMSKVHELKNTEIGNLEVTKISLITTNVVCHPNKTKIIETYNLQ